MEFLDDYTFDSSTTKVEPGNLLEQGWFFGNFLDKKTKMSRSCSDLSSSSIPTQEMLVTKSYDKEIQSSSSLKKKGGRNSSTTSSSKDKGGRSLRLSKANSRTNGLVRAPSLPTCVGKIEIDFEDDDDDEESEFTMGRLIRQASLNLSDVKSPPSNSSKVIKQSCSIPRQQPRKKQDIVETITNKTRSKHNLESKQVEDFKNMGSNFEKLNLNPCSGRVNPGHEEMEKQKRPISSDAWLGQKSAVPNLPNWSVDKKNPSIDMKTQIKFWARAVASNVRQEC